MAVSYMDFTSPDVQFTYDLNQNVIFRKDPRNYIAELSIQQLNTLGNVSLLDIFLSKDNLVEPHYHQNASELVYCIAGAAVINVLNPFTKQLLHFPIKPGQVANVPQGWWHYDAATEDNTHLLAIFDAPVPDVILGSDILRLTPPEVLAHSYCLDREKIAQALAPLQQTVFIGPPKDCHHSQVQGTPAAKPTIKIGASHSSHMSSAQGGYSQPGMMAPGMQHGQQAGMVSPSMQPGQYAGMMSAPMQSGQYGGMVAPAMQPGQQAGMIPPGHQPGMTQPVSSYGYADTRTPAHAQSAYAPPAAQSGDFPHAHYGSYPGQHYPGNAPKRWPFI
ncbi:hypothetical protein PA598K_05754 [Paenibacillus sp. 598K]|nr:hypothetical protein PA598K_05754 [Paenibacillus sp. 598K]